MNDNGYNEGVRGWLRRRCESTIINPIERAYLPFSTSRMTTSKRGDRNENENENGLPGPSSTSPRRRKEEELEIPVGMD